MTSENLHTDNHEVQVQGQREEAGNRWEGNEEESLDDRNPWGR